MFKTLLDNRFRRTGLARVLRSEPLEKRHMMAGDTYLPYHNDLIAEDTNLDYNVTALDALLVINAINSGQDGALPTDGVGKADGARVDVSADNYLTALDALQVINYINGEGEPGDIVGFEFEFRDSSGALLPNNTASVGQLVQLRAYVQDLRGFSAKGVFTAFLDINFSDASKFQLNVGEGQSFNYFYDRINPNNTTSNFKFTFDGQTTGAVSLFNTDGSARTDSDLAPVIQSALEALPNIGAGNVLVRVDAVAAAADATANRLRNNFDIIFINQLAGRDVPLVTVDTSGIVMQTGQTLVFEMKDKYPADPTNAEAFTNAFFFTNEFTTGRNAASGTEGGVAQFDEVGATGGLGAPSNPGARRVFFSATLKTLAAGTVTFTPNPAEVFPAHQTLVFPKDIVPTDLIEYGQPFTLTIASNLVAVNDAFPVAEDAASAQYNVTSNDTVISGGPFTITAVGATSNGGTVSIAAGGSQVNYQPAPNFFGQETFTYTITNTAGSATGTVTMTVTAVNDPISVPNQTASTNLGKAVTRTTAELTQGGTAGPGEASQVLSIASANSPSANGGTVSLQSGSVTYTPAPSFAGTDTFTIVVTDDGQTNGANDFKTQTVTVSVTVTNDPPDAVDDLFDTIDEDTSNNTLNVLANDSAGTNDVGDTLTITATGGTPTGTVSIAPDGKSLIYSTTGTVGVDTFTYTVRDRAGATDTATVSVDVQATVLPRARVDRATFVEDSTTPVPIDVLDNDRTTAGSVATLISFSQPSNGTVTLNDNGTPADLTDDTLSYVANANFSGNDIFTYVINETPSNGGVNSTGTVTVTVTDVNDPPVIANDTASAVEDTVTTITSTTLLGNDSPGVGETTTQTLSITAAQAVSATGGTVAVSGGNVVYTPAQDFVGQFVFTYTATDTGTPASTGTGTVTVTVTPVNDAPVAGNNTDTTAEDTAKTITSTTLFANDTPGPATASDESTQTLTIVAVSPASANGGTVTLTGGGGSVVYTPALNFNGTDTFTYTVRDNGSPAAEATATVTMTVTAVNDAPTAVDDVSGTSKGLAVTISPTTLLSNDSPGPANESSQTLSITGVSGALNGTVALVGGQIVFTPAQDYSGPASFQYTITDNGQTNGGNDFKTDTGTVSVNVQDFQPTTLTGLVYVDETNDGTKQAAERTLGGVTINLVGTALNQPVSRSFITLADGSYSFGNLAPGVYTISIVNPTLMIDGLDTAGSLGDSDGIANNNSFTFTVAAPGGFAVSGYNFSVVGVTDGYASTMERLASRYFASGSAQVNNGLYGTLGADGSQKWFSKLNGYDDIVFAEVSLDSAGTECTLTVVDSAHNVRTTTLGKGKFLTMYDNAGNTIVRVLGGLNQLNFTSISLAAPPVSSANRFLDAIDDIFAQQGW